MGVIHRAAYAVAAILAAWVWLGRKEKIRLIVALDKAGLCVNKQLDLQSLFTEIGRVAPYHGGGSSTGGSIKNGLCLASSPGSGFSGRGSSGATTRSGCATNS